MIPKGCLSVKVTEVPMAANTASERSADASAFGVYLTIPKIPTSGGS